MSMVLSVTGASKRFGANQALDGAVLQLARGEWLALLGPNGAGKTTLIRAVAGRIRLDLISYYAAGIGVMFLLFSMVGAAGSILEEEEIGTLERLLTSNVSMMTLLLSSWIFFAAMGFIQVTMMFVFGALVFDVELWTVNHLMGFLVMTLVTAASASALGIALATLCTSRAQLNAISTIVILTMSAIGGSMMPRIFMPEVLKKAGLFTFNGWALDGYLKVFWYDSPGDSLLTALTSLWPQVAVLSGLTILFLVMAGVAAKRWEAS